MIVAETAMAQRAALRVKTRGLDPFDVYPKDCDDLLRWIEDATGHHIPNAGVCPGHDAPSALVCDFFFNEVSEGLALANRAGGKTFDVAALHLANNHHKPGFEVSHIGAIETQAKRCYAYYGDGLRHKDEKGVAKLQAKAPDPHIRETVWLNGSKIEILPGTEAQTQGGHPHLATYDELEQGKRQPYENAKSMPVERRYNGTRHRGQFLATSTRQTSLGLMQRALDEAEETGTRVYEWCVFETMEPCDGQEGRPECNGEECPLWQWCEGRAVEADGWRSRDEIIGMYRRVGIDTWEAQHLCIKPDAKALIYAPFSKANITEEAEYVAGAGPLWLAYDWGFTDPTHICFLQQRDGAFYQFDELVGSNRSEREWVRAIVRVVVALEGYEGPTVEGVPAAGDDTKPVSWEDIWGGKEPWPRPRPNVWPEAIGDPSAVQMRAELKEHIIGAAKPAKVKHNVEEGQDVLRAAILSGSDLRRYFVHPRCKETIRCLSNYRARELSDGSFDPRPDPDPANHAFSHGCDALRYLMWRLRRALGITTGGNDGTADTPE